MRICILEWTCGGGIQDCNPSDSMIELRDEGWTMLECLCQQFSAAGHAVSTVADRRLLDASQWLRLSDCVSDLIGLGSPHELGAIVANFPSDSASDFPIERDAVDTVLDVWLAIARRCDATIVVAPELDGILQRCIQRLSLAGITLINCSGHFLQACCDKWTTAQLLQQAGMPHPSTWMVSDFLPEYKELAERWCIKPRWGAGCEGLMVLESSEVERTLVEQRMDGNLLIQPWIEGEPYSCSAILDAEGSAHWMPLVTQDFSWKSIKDADSANGCAQRESSLQQLSYRGGSLVSPQLSSKNAAELAKLLNASLKALSGELPGELRGWIGVDLVLDRGQRWTIIEVNSRMTTSVVELCRVGAVEIGTALLSCYNCAQPEAL